MSRYFVGLPKQQIRNSLIDFSPVNQGLESISKAKQQHTQNALAERKMNMAEDQFAYQRGRDQKADAKSDVEWYGKQASAVDQMQGPQREAAWQRIISKHGAEGLTPEEMDPMTGPKLLMAQAGQFVDPLARETAQAKLGLIHAKINKMNRESEVAGEQYGKSGTIVQDKDGNFYSVQFGSNGQKKIEPLSLGGNGLVPSRGVDVVGDTMFNKATGVDVRNVGQNLAAGERAKTEGREAGKSASALPKVELAMKQYEVNSDVVEQDIDRAIKLAGGLTTTGIPGAITSKIPATPAYDLREVIMGVKANIGFDKLQSMRDASPTGGALGQVSEQENKLLQSVVGSLEQAQSQAQIVFNLQRLKKIISQYRDLKRQAYEDDVKRFGAANVPNPETSHLPTAGQSTKGRSLDLGDGFTVDF